MPILLAAFIIYIASTAALYWMAIVVRGTALAWVYALALGAVAAYAAEFAAETQLLQTFGVIPGNQPCPVVTWSAVAWAAIVVAGIAKPPGVPIAVPCTIIAGLALQHGIYNALTSLEELRLTKTQTAWRYQDYRNTEMRSSNI